MLDCGRIIVVIRNNERKRKNERKRNNEREITIT
jgi:hypothetical protein